MEPRILMIGRRQEVIDILAEELRKFGRNIHSANDQEKIEKLLKSQAFDFVVIGAGLPDHQRDFLTSLIESIKPGLPVYMIERKEKSKPQKLIKFTNQKALEFKIDMVSKKKDSSE
jgi:DNA-binding NtrC family response regulator